MGSFLKSFAAELLPEWLKSKREGKDAVSVEPRPKEQPPAAPVAAEPPQRAGKPASQDP